MADVGLDAELELDVTRALRAVGQVEDATDRASRVVLTADARQVVSSIEAALASVDTQLTIEGDARDVTTSVDAAVAAADTQLSIFGEASDVTGSIDAAVQAADTHVDIDVDAPGLPKVRDDLEDVADRADRAATSSGRLRGALAAVSAVAVARGIYEIVQAASDLEESVSKATVVFGDSFGDIQAFADEAATAVGLSNAEALEATATFGNLFQALGATQDTAAGLSPQVVTLAADLASFNNLGVDETLEKLRSGLVGEVEPLRSLGVSFNAAEVEAKALELGLADANGEVSEGAKLQARFAIIMEQTTLAQGDFARTSDGLANQQRILTAEFKNAVTEIGVGLLPTFKDLVTSGRDLLPVFVEFAQTVLPPLVSIFSDLLPLGGSFLQLLTLLGPVISVVASAVDAIPEPLIIMVGAMVAANQVIGGVQSGMLSLASSASKAMTSLFSMNPALLVVTAAVGAAAVVFARHAADEAKFRAEVEELTTALRDQDGVLRITTDGLAGYVETSSRFESRNQTDDLARLGATFADVAALSRQGAEGLQEFSERALRAGEVTLAYNNTQFDLAEAQETFNNGAAFTADQLSTLADGYVIAANGTRLYLSGNDDLIASFEELQDATQAAAEQELDRIAGLGGIEASLVLAARATNLLEDGTVDSAAALEAVQGDLDAVAEANERAAAETEANAARQLELAASSDEAAEAQRRIASAIAAVSSEATLGFPPTINALTDLAIALREGAATEQEMQAAADALGVSVENLQGFVDSATGSFDDFASAAVDAFPSVADAVTAAFVEMEDGSDVFSLEKFRDELAATVEAARAFPLNVQFLIDQGFTDLAAIAPQLGADVVQGIVTGIQSGDPAVAAEVNGLLGQFQDVLGPGGTLPEFMSGVAAPQIALSTGEMARLASEAFGPAFDLLDPATQELVATQLAVSGAIAPIAAEAGAIGTLSRAAMSEQFAGAPGDFQEILDSVETTTTTTGTGVTSAATLIGGSAAAGMVSALGVVPGETSAIVFATGQVFAVNKQRLQELAGAAGYGVGRSFSEGIRDGIDSYVGQIRAAAAGAVNAAEAAARQAANSNSPSLLFAALGEDLGAGIAQGLDDTAALVAASAASLIADVAGSAQDRIARVDPQVTAAGRGQAVGGDTLVQVSVVVNGAISSEQAKAIGASLGDGIAEKLDRLQVVTNARTQ